jgi:hypothetical protein
MGKIFSIFPATLVFIKYYKLNIYKKVNYFMKSFIIATKKILSKEILEHKLELHYKSSDFSYKKASKILYENIQDDGILEQGDDYYDSHYENFKNSYDFKEIFKDILKDKEYHYFYPGILHNHQLIEKDIIDDDFAFCLSKKRK